MEPGDHHGAGRRPGLTVNLIGGFSNKTLRPLVAGLLDQPYTQNRCSYGLTRLRMKGLIVRLPHSNTYVLTDDGQRFAVFYTKLHNLDRC